MHDAVKGRASGILVHSGIDVQNWRQTTVDQRRPSHCPRCSYAAGIAGDRVIVGHGTYRRQLRGPAGLPDHIWLQRFLCRACRATFTVGPDDLLARRLYRVSTIVAALRFWLDGHTTFACRQRFDADCPSPRRADEDRQSWTTIRRWAWMMADLLVAEPDKRQLMRAQSKPRGLRWLARESLAEADRFGDGVITPAMPNGP